MIFTFYSFKGGVGRSMALANVAQWFYSKGLRVVMVDWDLEAPGLETFFYSENPVTRSQPPTGLPLPDVRSRPGLIDLLLSYQRAFAKLGLPSQTTANATAGAVAAPSPALGGTGTASAKQTPLEILRDVLPPLGSVLCPLHGANDRAGDEETRAGELWLLSAGWRAGDRFSDYAAAVQSFDWTGFYNSYHGDAYFEWLRERLLERADVVLIDSRTGVTEMVGVCARQLADVVVALCAPNDQNLDGVTTMVKSFTRPELASARHGRPLQVVVVPARIDGGAETSLRNIFERNFKAAVGEAKLGGVGCTPWELRIPYVTMYSYSEKLAVGAPDRAEDMEKAYRELALHLALLAPEASPLRRKLVGELKQRFVGLLPSVAVVSLRTVANRRAEQPHATTATQDLLSKLAAAGTEPLALCVGASGDGAESDWDAVTRALDHVTDLVVVLDSVEDAASWPPYAPLRHAWREARRRGVRVLAVKRGPEAARPPWLGRAALHDIERDADAIVRHLAVPERVLRAPMAAPDPPACFVGRQAELERVKALLLDGLRAEQNQPCWVGIWGLAGSGKSSLAAAVCADPSIQSTFDDGTFWVSRLNNQGDLLRGLNEMHAALTGEDGTFTDVESGTQRLAEMVGDRRCLLILDDVMDATILRPLMPIASHISCLLTSRRLDVPVDLGAIAVELGSLGVDEARELLLGAIPPDRLQPSDAVTEQHLRSFADAVVVSLGALPLAVSLARRNVAGAVALGVAPADAVKKLSEAIERAGIGGLEAPATGASTPAAIPESLRVSLIEVIDALPPADRQRLRQLAQSAERPLPSQEMAGILNIGSQEAADFCRRARERGLLTVSAGQAEDEFRLHPIVRLYFVELAPTLHRGEVFISAARDDVDFIRRMTASLASSGWTPTFEPSEDHDSAAWVQAALVSADAVVFVITPASIASNSCTKELLEAERVCKRVVPVLRRDVDPAYLPQEFKERNLLRAREQDDFDAAMRALVELLNEDEKWTRMHTELLVDANKWNSAGRASRRLLPPAALRQAEAWLAQAGERRGRTPSPAHLQYILASRRYRQRRHVLQFVAAAVLVVVGTGAALWSYASYARNKALALADDAQMQLSQRLNAETAKLDQQNKALADALAQLQQVSTTLPANDSVQLAVLQVADLATRMAGQNEKDMALPLAVAAVRVAMASAPRALPQATEALRAVLGEHAWEVIYRRENAGAKGAGGWLFAQAPYRTGNALFAVYDGTRLATFIGDPGGRHIDRQSVIEVKVPVSAIAFRDDGREPIVASTAEGLTVLEFDGVKPRRRRLGGDPLPAEVDRVALAGDGNWLAAQVKAELRLWRWRENEYAPVTLPEPRGSDGPDALQALAFNATGEFMAALRNGRIGVWWLNNEGGEPRINFGVSRGQRVTSFAFADRVGLEPRPAAHDAPVLLATAHADGSVGVWDIRSGKQRFDVPPWARPALCLAFAPNELALAGLDEVGQVYLWAPPSAKPQTIAPEYWWPTVLRAPRRGGAVIGGAADDGIACQAALAFTPDSSALLVADGDELRRHPLTAESLLQLAPRGAMRDLTPAEWARYFHGLEYQPSLEPSEK